MTNEINASHILVKTEKEAKEALESIKKGSSFESIAQEKSFCPSNKNGGALGWFGRGMMVKEFEEACFSSKKGEIIGPVKTEFGFHVIKINELN